MTDNLQKAFNSGIVVATARMMKNENAEDYRTIDLDEGFFIASAMQAYGFEKDDVDQKFFVDM